MSLLDLVTALQPDTNTLFVADQEKINLGFELTSPESSDMKGQLKTAEAALTYMTSGNAYVTLRSAKTGTRFTYRISRGKCSRCHKMDCNCWAHPVLFVKVLTGPENESDYRYFGFIKDGKFVFGGAKSKISQSAPSAAAFEWSFKALTQKMLPVNLEVWHDGRCGRCGRKLTVPGSVERGIGPECASIMGK